MYILFFDTPKRPNFTPWMDPFQIQRQPVSSLFLKFFQKRDFGTLFYSFLNEKRRRILKNFLRGMK